MVETIRSVPGDSATTPQFEVALYPHRSLSPPGFLVVMGIFVLAAGIAGGYFLLLGAWPVFGFFGLDIALLYWGFRASYRTGEICEYISLSENCLLLKRSRPGSDTATWRFNPCWVDFAAASPPGLPAGLRFRCHGDLVVFGTFLNNQELQLLATTLSDRLMAARTTIMR